MKQLFILILLFSSLVGNARNVYILGEIHDDATCMTRSNQVARGGYEGKIHVILEGLVYGDTTDLNKRAEIINNAIPVSYGDDGEPSYSEPTVSYDETVSLVYGGELSLSYNLGLIFDAYDTLDDAITDKAAATTDDEKKAAQTKIDKVKDEILVLATTDLCSEVAFVKSCKKSATRTKLEAYLAGSGKDEDLLTFIGKMFKEYLKIVSHKRNYPNTDTYKVFNVNDSIKKLKSADYYLGTKEGRLDFKENYLIEWRNYFMSMVFSDVEAKSTGDTKDIAIVVGSAHMIDLFVLLKMVVPKDTSIIVTNDCSYVPTF